MRELEVNGVPIIGFLSSFSFLWLPCSACPFACSESPSSPPITPLTFTTVNNHSYKPLPAIVIFTSSLNSRSSPCESVFSASSKRLCNLTIDADFADLRNSVWDRSSRWVRKEDWDRKKYRLRDRRRGISCWSLRSSWRSVWLACV